MRRLLILTGIAALTVVGLTTAWAGPFTADPLVLIPGASPFGSCTADNVAGQSGTNFPDTVVEPWVDVNPTDPDNIVAGIQQDRWSNGGARGLVALRSTDGGTTWEKIAIPNTALCSGGTAANGGDFQRASDPWLSFAPNGDLYFMSLSFDDTTPPGRAGGFGKNAMLVSKSTDGGLTWSDPITLIKDTNPRVLNDKNSLTADPVDSNRVYAVWDRLQLPLGTVIRPENVIGLGFKGPVMFSRTTDGGLSWEPARKIYDPAGNNQTIGNQIVVLPDGTLVNLFNEILNFRNDDGGAQFDFNLSLIRSTDQGVTWTSGRAIRAAKIQSLALVRAFGVVDPDTGDGVRTGDIIPEVTVDRNPGSPGQGNLYAVWQDARFSGFQIDEVAFALSTDGGSTWSAPIKINQTPTGIRLGDRQAFTPTVKVAADGTIGVTYYDFRNNTPCPIVGGEPDCTGVPLNTDYFIVHCHAACSDPANWAGNETQLTSASFDMRKAPVARGFFVGDYEGLATSGDQFRPLFVQSGAVADTSDAFTTEVGP